MLEYLNLYATYHFVIMFTWLAFLVTIFYFINKKKYQNNYNSNILILKVRFAKGEITLNEFKELKNKM